MVVEVETKTLGDKVRITRLSKRYSQHVLALIAHVTQDAVSKVERNLPIPEETKQKILKALDLLNE